MTKKLLLSNLLSLLIVTVASADVFYDENPTEYGTMPGSSGFYLGAGYSTTNVTDDYYEYFPTPPLSVQTDLEYDAVMLQAGYEYNPYIAFEMRYWVALSDASYSLDSNFAIPDPLPGSYSDFDAFGFYIKPMYPVSEQFSVYALAGIAGVYVDGEPGWDLLNESDFSWGLGASFDLTPQFTLFVDYVQLFDDTLDYYYGSTQDTAVDTINFGVSFRF